MDVDGVADVAASGACVCRTIARMSCQQCVEKMNCSRTLRSRLASHVFFLKARLADWLLCFRLQDLQIYLSDVFELGIEELNEAIRF